MEQLPCNISIVVPLLNEAASLPELYTWIQKVCDAHGLSFEVLFVDDGSTDHSWEVIRELHRDDARVRGIRFLCNYGKSAALNEGFRACRGEVTITMDADLQDSPEAIPLLYSKIMEEGFDMVSGWKQKRYDNVLTKNIPSKIFNFVARRVTGIPLHDFNCGLKAYKAEVVKHVEIFGEMHRYIPFLVVKAGFRRIGEVVVPHRARKYGVSKFGLDRFINGFLDLLTIKFLSTFGRQPMHFFGVIGSLSFAVGTGILFYLTIEKFFFFKYEMARRPLFYVAIMACLVGTQLFLAGFIAELIVRTSQDRNQYSVRDQL